MSVLTRMWEAVLQPPFDTRWSKVSQVFRRAAVEASCSTTPAVCNNYSSLGVSLFSREYLIILLKVECLLQEAVKVPFLFLPQMT